MTAHDRHRGQRGQAIVLVGLLMVVVVGIAGVAIDVGSAMSDRRILQADSDAAALAGVRSLSGGTAVEHYVAMQYLGRALGFTLPTGTCLSTSNCPGGTYTTGNYTITLADPASQTLDVTVQHTLPTTFSRLLGFGSVSNFASTRAAPQAAGTTPLGYTLAVTGGDAHVNGGGTSNPSGDVGGAVYVAGNFGSNNGSHAPSIPTVAHNYDGTACSGSGTNHLDLGGNQDSLSYVWTPSGTGTVNTNVTAPTVAASAPLPNGSRYTSAAGAKDLTGNWKPGTYDGIYPTGGLLNPGIYQIVNVTRNVNLGTSTNAIPPASGVLDASGAVAIVLDSSDTGNLVITKSIIDGIDDLNSAGISGSVDPLGTHNFAIYGATFQGRVTIGAAATTDITGVMYLPNSDVTINGNSSPTFVGSMLVNSVTINGSGNGTQTFDWVCSLATVDPSHAQGGLIR